MTTKEEADMWEKQEGAGMWLPTEKGDELIGEVTDILEGTYGRQYVIRKEDGEETKTPSHKVLVNRMVKAKIGDSVKIVFEEEVAPAVRGQNPTKIYSVYIKK